jgi:hypothetical protein
MPDLMRAVDRVCDAHYDGVRAAIEKHDITWVKGSARFLAAYDILQRL